MRGKIALAVAALGAVMLCSAAVSLLELKRLRSAIGAAVEASASVTDLSDKMSVALQEHNTALLQISAGRNGGTEAGLAKGREDFEAALAGATVTVKDREELDSIYIASDNYFRTAVEIAVGGSGAEEIAQFAEVYGRYYSELASAINSHIHRSRNSLAAKASELESNAYRAVAPGILALGATILILSMLFALLDLHYIRPLRNMTKSLGDYLNLNIPFNPKLEGKDELHTLRKHIEALILRLKKRGEGAEHNNQSL